jgi:hypothetical protein
MQLNKKITRYFILYGIVIIIMVVGFYGCISSYHEIIIDDSLYQSAPRDPITINNIQLYINLLQFNVSYGGGCKEHEFKLMATSFMESYPIQVNILLSHEDNDDPCDMWITETLVFSILPLKRSWQQSYNEKSGIIVMNIQGWIESINYEF